jgi:hypothetical protein
MLDRRAEDRGDIGDSPAARGNRHRLPGADLIGQVQPVELRMHFGRRILDPRSLEVLSHAEYLWKGCQAKHRAVYGML